MAAVESALPPGAEAIPAALHAGFVSRLVAFAIDLVVLAVAITASSWFISTVDALLRPWARVDLTIGVVAAIPVIVVAYFAGLWRLAGQTVGKWLLGIAVVTADGKRVSIGRGLLRLVGYVVSALPFYAGFLWVLVDPQRRALHDRLARTHVIYVDRSS